MKKSIFTFLLFSSVAFAHAQFEKGDRYWGGNVGLGFSSSSFNQNSSILTGSGNNFGINLNPTFFKAVKSNSPQPTLGVSDSAITSLTINLRALILVRDDLASRTTPNNPLLSNYENQIKKIRDSILANILRPKKGYGENANTLRGFTAGLSFSNSNNRQNQNSSYLKSVNNGINTSIGYAIRKYKPLSEKLFWYMEYNANIAYNYSWQKSTYTNPNSTTKSDGMGYNASIGVLPALALKVDNRLLVDINFGGLSTGYNYSSSEGYHAHNYFVNLNLTSRFTLGILWKLKKSSRS